MGIVEGVAVLVIGGRGGGRVDLAEGLRWRAQRPDDDVQIY